MSDLSFIEKRKLEKLFQMGGGYSGSKANRLRAFGTQEANHLVGKLVADLLEYCRPASGDPDRNRLFEECERIAARLLQSTPVDALEAITPEWTGSRSRPVAYLRHEADPHPSQRDAVSPSRGTSRCTASSAST